jgi:hypothetical protein
VPCLLVGQIDQRTDYGQHRYASGSAVARQISNNENARLVYG